MLRSPFVRWTLGAVVVVLALGALRAAAVVAGPALPVASTTAAPRDAGRGVPAR